MVEQKPVLVVMETTTTPSSPCRKSAGSVGSRLSNGEQHRIASGLGRKFQQPAQVSRLEAGGFLITQVLHEKPAHNLIMV